MNATRSWDRFHAADDGEEMIGIDPQENQDEPD
jgi:hypothetical protein